MSRAQEIISLTEEVENKKKKRQSSRRAKAMKVLAGVSSAAVLAGTGAYLYKRGITRKSRSILPSVAKGAGSVLRGAGVAVGGVGRGMAKAFHGMTRTGRAISNWKMKRLQKRAYKAMIKLARRR